MLNCTLTWIITVSSFKVHVTGGITSLIATTLLGPRNGRFYNDLKEKLESPKPFPGHSKSLQVS